MKAWCDTNVIYQIYPRSFMDSNDDGIGDVRGIIDKIDYLSETLGVEAIWLSPIFLSPQKDFGYDVSDHIAVDPCYGTLDDVKSLIAVAHEQNIKVMFDLVPNHTSDQHAWFKEARQSRDNPHRDYYVWRDAVDGHEPNNWLSLAGGKAWTWDQATGQYYLHSFMDSQPDLNWDNPAVRAEMQNVLRYWFELGVDGFRVDAVWAISKDPDLADDPQNDDFEGSADQFGYFIHSKCRNGARLSEYLDDLASVAAEYDNRFLIFEYYPDSQLGDAHAQTLALNAIRPDVASVFYFEALNLPWSADAFGRTLADYLGRLPGQATPVFCFGNHDQTRMVSRYGVNQARLIAVLQMTLPGLPVMYYGEELGMADFKQTTDSSLDGFGTNGAMGGRDPERTPMQWNTGANAGFSERKPWLPVSLDYAQNNVAVELNDPASLLSLYRKLVSLRRDPVMRVGSFSLLSVSSGYVLAYERKLDSQTYVIALNFADAEQRIELPVSGQLVCSSKGDLPHYDGYQLNLRGYEAVVISAGATVR